MGRVAGDGQVTAGDGLPFDLEEELEGFVPDADASKDYELVDMDGSPLPDDGIPFSVPLSADLSRFAVAPTQTLFADQAWMAPLQASWAGLLDRYNDGRPAGAVPDARELGRCEMPDGAFGADRAYSYVGEKDEMTRAAVEDGVRDYCGGDAPMLDRVDWSAPGLLVYEMLCRRLVLPGMSVSHGDFTSEVRRHGVRYISTDGASGAADRARVVFYDGPASFAVAMKASGGDVVMFARGLSSTEPASMHREIQRRSRHLDGDGRLVAGDVMRVPSLSWDVAESRRSLVGVEMQSREMRARGERVAVDRVFQVMRVSIDTDAGGDGVGEATGRSFVCDGPFVVLAYDERARDRFPYLVARIDDVACHQELAPTEEPAPGHAEPDGEPEDSGWDLFADVDMGEPEDGREGMDVGAGADRLTAAPTQPLSHDQAWAAPMQVCWDGVLRKYNADRASGALSGDAHELDGRGYPLSAVGTDRYGVWVGKRDVDGRAQFVRMRMGGDGGVPAEAGMVSWGGKGYLVYSSMRRRIDLGGVAREDVTVLYDDGRSFAVSIRTSDGDIVTLAKGLSESSPMAMDSEILDMRDEYDGEERLGDDDSLSVPDLVLGACQDVPGASGIVLSGAHRSSPFMIGQVMQVVGIDLSGIDMPGRGGRRFGFEPPFAVLVLDARVPDPLPYLVFRVDDMGLWR